LTDRSVNNIEGRIAQTTLVPRIVDKPAKRADLIHAALSAFAEKGYHHATMQDVAERAGVSKGAVYEYFASKQDLFVCSADTLMRAMFEPALERFEAGAAPIRERVADFVRQSITGVAEWSSLCASVAQVWAELGADEGSPLRVLMREQYSSSADRIAAAFERAVSRGDAAHFATRPAALALMALLDGLLLQAMILGESAIREIVTPEFLDWCCALVPRAEPLSKVNRC